MLFYIKRMPKSADSIADSNADSYTDVKSQQKKFKLKQISPFGHFLGVKLHKIEFLSFQRGS